MSVEKPHIAYIGLGANLDNPAQQIREALLALHNTTEIVLTTYSSLYHNPAIGQPNQPDYINACAALETHLSAPNLLQLLQTIEQERGRERSEVHWGPRTLDLDLLLFDHDSLKTPTLTLPHPELLNRRFVLIPLLEIAPQVQLPCGDKVASFLDACPQHPLTRQALISLTEETA